MSMFKNYFLLLAYMCLISSSIPLFAQTDHGFTNLFNGKDFSNWDLKAKDADKLTIEKLFTAHDNCVHVFGDLPDSMGLDTGGNGTHGMMYTKKKYSRYVFKFEYKWGKKKFNNFGQFQYDAGMYYHVSDSKIWPVGIEYQVRYDHLKNKNHTGDFWSPPGTKIQWYSSDGINFDPPFYGGKASPIKLREHRALETAPYNGLNDEWNHCEVIVMGNKYAIHKLNGIIVNMATDLSDRTGIIGLQSETAEIYYRNIMIKEFENDEPIEHFLPKKSIVTIQGNEFYINGKPTYANRTWNGKKIQGLLMNSRMVQGVFDDLNPLTKDTFAYPDTKIWDAERNNKEYIQAMAIWKSYGLNAITLNMQGGSPFGYGNFDFYNPGFKSDGSLDSNYMRRLDNVLKRADELQMVVILGLFYFGQDQRLKDETAIKNAVTNMINWLHKKEYRNVLIEINNETLPNKKEYDHDILLMDRVHELINLAKSIQKNGYRYLVSTSFPAVVDPTKNVVDAADFVLFHANALRTAKSFTDHIAKVKTVVGDRVMPIVINEDDNHYFEKDTSHFNIALENYISWGFFDYRKKDNPDLKEGFQTIPVDWGINSDKKKAFFNQVKEVTSGIENDKLRPVKVETIFPKVVVEIFIDTVWAANKANFAFQTVGKRQFVAYYDKDRMMTVATRKLGDKHWIKKTLNNKLRWDSHNYVVLALDSKGFIHVSGNMHVNPLAYFKSSKPYDVSSMKEINMMTGKNEGDVTYPSFFYDKDGSLYFNYRSGSSGNGNTFVNKYSTTTKKWERYIDVPLFEGKTKDSKRSAYHQFTRDKSGNFHYAWLWRWTPAVETCHQLSYATTSDLKNWKNAAGEPIELPLKPDNPKLIVDNTPTMGGTHNGKYKLIITPDQKPLIGYLKYDDLGLTQLYLAKYMDGAWVSKKVSDWNFRWKFFGGGDKMSEGANFTFEEFTSNDVVAISWSTEVGEKGIYIIDLNTLMPINETKNVVINSKYPKKISERWTNDPNISVNLQEDMNSNKNGSRYILKWESAGRSHGSSAPKVIPEYPRSALVMYKIEK